MTKNACFFSVLDESSYINAYPLGHVRLGCVILGYIIEQIGVIWGDKHFFFALYRQAFNTTALRPVGGRVLHPGALFRIALLKFEGESHILSPNYLLVSSLESLEGALSDHLSGMNARIEDDALQELNGGNIKRRVVRLGIEGSPGDAKRAEHLLALALLDRDVTASQALKINRAHRGYSVERHIVILGRDSQWISTLT